MTSPSRLYIIVPPPPSVMQRMHCVTEGGAGRICICCLVLLLPQDKVYTAGRDTLFRLVIDASGYTLDTIWSDAVVQEVGAHGTTSTQGE